LVYQVWWRRKKLTGARCVAKKIVTHLDGIVKNHLQATLSSFGKRLIPKMLTVRTNLTFYDTIF